MIMWTVWTKRRGCDGNQMARGSEIDMLVRVIS
jgi:hypothetical protein